MHQKIPLDFKKENGEEGGWRVGEGVGGGAYQVVVR